MSVNRFSPVFRIPSLFGLALVLVVLTFVACARSAETEAEVADTDREASSPEMVAVARAKEMGVSVESTPTEVIFRAEQDGFYVLRTSRDLESWVVERLPAGQEVAHHRDQQLVLLGHVLSYPLDCKPGVCPTPKPIPLTAGGNGVPGAEERPGRTGSNGISCFCDDLTTRARNSPCYEECKDKPVRVQG